MIGYCKKLKQEVLSESDCAFCEADLTLCRHWRNEKETFRDTVIEFVQLSKIVNPIHYDKRTRDRWLDLCIQLSNILELKD